MAEIDHELGFLEFLVEGHDLLDEDFVGFLDIV